MCRIWNQKIQVPWKNAGRKKREKSSKYDFFDLIRKGFWYALKMKLGISLISLEKYNFLCLYNGKFDTFVYGRKNHEQTCQSEKEWLLKQIIYRIENIYFDLGIKVIFPRIWVCVFITEIS